MIDKYKTCKDCPDRCISPNCHSTCEGYIYRTEKREKIKAERKRAGDYSGYLFDESEIIRKRYNRYKNRRKYR